MPITPSNPPFPAPEPLAEIPKGTFLLEAQETRELLSLEFEEVEQRLKSHGEISAYSETWSEQLRLVRRLAELDPHRAAAAALQLSAAHQDAAMSVVLSTWLRTDPQGAWNWLNANVPDVLQLESYYRSFFGGLAAAGQSDHALRIIAEIPEGNLKHVAVGSLSREMARYDPEKLILLMDTLPEGRSRDQTVSNFAQTWAGEDPEAATSWLTSIPDATAQRSTLDRILRTWAGADQNAALAWVRSLPFSNQTDRSKYAIASQISRSDSDTAFQLIGEIQGESTRRSALSGFGFNMARERGLEAVVPYVERIPPGLLRDSAVLGVAQALRQRDPADAENFVRTSPLVTEEHRVRLLEMLKSFQR